MHSAAAVIPTLALLTILGACGGDKNATGDDASASDSDTSTGTSTSAPDTTGESTDTDTSATSDSATTGESDTDTGEAPALACDGARWVRVHRPGEFYAVAIDSRGHTVASGTLAHDFAPNDGIITDLDGDGGLVRNILAASLSDDSVAASDVDGGDLVRALVYEKNNEHLRAYDPEGALAGEALLADLGVGPSITGFAVGPGGETVVSVAADALGASVIKISSEGAVVWAREFPIPVRVQAINAAGTIAGSRSRDGVLTLTADGSLAWDVDWPLFNAGHVDLTSAGEVAIGGETDDGVLTVARFDGGGALLHSSLFNVLNTFDTINDLAINDAGEIAIAGTVQGPSPLTAYVVKLDAAGEIVMSHFCEEEPDSRANAVALSPSGEVRIAGSVGIDLDPYMSFVAAF